MSKYDYEYKDEPEMTPLATLLGGLLIVCICALLIAGTAAIIKWILGV